MPDFARATVWRGQADDVRVSGETLRQVRLSQGLSMERLARRADVSYATIVRAERGRDNREAALRRETVERIAQALGVVPALLIRRGKGTRNGRNHEHPGKAVRDGGAPGGPGARGAHPAVGDRVDGDAVRDAG
jgi:DNA-binding XRE family transcriptional regulator